MSLWKGSCSVQLLIVLRGGDCGLGLVAAPLTSYSQLYDQTSYNWENWDVRDHHEMPNAQLVFSTPCPCCLSFVLGTCTGVNPKS